jgi:membrane-bound metal-dependent hydrolase YbcI (DUF457 family)
MVDRCGAAGIFAITRRMIIARNRVSCKYQVEIAVMDIATHAMAGTIIAIPFLPTAPLSATCFIFGSVLPDTDAFSRLFGKVAFLRWHQTYTHSLPIIFLASAFFWLSAQWMEINEVYAPLAFGAGMILHVLMDATNTYGVALFAPISRKRICVEWLFFIDGIVVTVSIACLTTIFVCLNYGQSTWVAAVSIIYDCFLVLYWLFRGLLYRRAVRFLPYGIRRLIPSALVPWHLSGYALCENEVQLFELNAIAGTTNHLGTLPIFDLQYKNLLTDVVEYNLMRELSSGYYVVSVIERDGKTEMDCRDLRTRNFGGEFGRLELFFGAGGKLERKIFHV